MKARQWVRAYWLKWRGGVVFIAPNGDGYAAYKRMDNPAWAVTMTMAGWRRL